MIKIKAKTILLIVLALIMILFPNYCTAKNTNTDNSSSRYYSKYDYVINKYNIDMVVNENNTFDITETITAYFNVPKHGIFRKIPLKNSVTRLDRSKSNNSAKISNININENYTTSNKGGYRVLKIGDSDKTVTGSHTYTIKYTYNIGKDPLKNMDELYFNLIGNEWDTIINNISFNITMPKAFDKSLLGFSSGFTGSTNSSNVEYSVNGNIISGTVNSTLLSGQSLTIRLSLPDGYFVVKGLGIDIFSIFTIILSLAFVFIAYILWSKHGKDEPVIETVEFYPPEGYNSAEVGFLYEGTVNNEGVISLLVYLANKGYLKIEETEETKLFSKSKGFTITKLKEYDGNNEYEKMFFDGLFKSKSAVTSSDLYNSFYKTLNKIKSKLNKKENKNIIFEPTSVGKTKWLIFMIITIFILITLKPLYEYGEDGLSSFFYALIFPAIGFLSSFTILFSGSNSIYVNGKSLKSTFISKAIAILWGCLFAGIPCYNFVLPCLLPNTVYLITYILGIICVAFLVFFMNIIPKRTPYGNEILGKLRGFKRFLETAEKPQLESLVMQNPEYFYNILPYTYALGVSDVWIKQFETIALEAPSWYSSHDYFDIHTFGIFMHSTMSSAYSSMSSSSSGGGSSGGGSGGGGGGSW